MVVRQRLNSGGIKTYYGLSSDSKPTALVPEGSKFFETDTGQLYTYSGDAWFKPVVDNPAGGGGGGGAGDASASNQTILNTRVGDLTEIAPLSDTASSGLNGRLQRLSQRVTDLLAVFPGALGAGGGLKIDGSGTALPISGAVTVTALPAGTNNIGDVDVLTVPADPFGANADALVVAGAVGSISAKLRRATQGLEDLKTTIVLAAGANAIGKLAANAGVTIGAVELAATQTLSTVTNLSQLGGQAIAMGTGLRTAGTQRVTVATDDVVPVSGSVGIAAGVNNIGDVDVLTVPADPFGANADAVVAAGAIGSISAKLRRATQGLEDLKTTIVLAAGANIIGKVGIDQTLPSTALTPFTTALSASTAIAVKASAGNLFSVSATNANAAVRYLQLHNRNVAPVSTNPPVAAWPIPAGTAAVPGRVLISTQDLGEAGYRCGIGIAIGISTALATYTAATAAEHVVNGSFV